MSVELALAGGGRLRLRVRGSWIELATDDTTLRLTRDEAWQLAEALDRIATSPEAD